MEGTRSKVKGCGRGWVGGGERCGDSFDAAREIVALRRRLCGKCCVIQRLSRRCFVFIRFGLGGGFGGIVVGLLNVAVWWCDRNDSGGSVSASAKVAGGVEVGSWW